MIFAFRYELWRGVRFIDAVNNGNLLFQQFCERVVTGTPLFAFTGQQAQILTKGMLVPTIQSVLQINLRRKIRKCFAP